LRAQGQALILIGCMFAIQHAAAQNHRPAKIGVLWGVDAAAAAPYQQALAGAMRARGWVDGANIEFIVRYIDGDLARIPAIVSELVALKVDVLYLIDPAITAARSATSTIPIVCADFYDPIDEGFTTKLSRPTWNVTGISYQSPESVAKRLELAKDLVPGLQRVAFLFDAVDRGALIEEKGIRNAAPAAKVELRTYPVRDLTSVEAAFAEMKRLRPDALIVSANALAWTARSEIARLAMDIRLPAISEVSEFAVSGFLLTYGPNALDTYARGAVYLDKVLRGAKPSDLPILNFRH
jgi:putative tryptophan/tyrosine transport system substrate-binding protein